MTTGMQFWDQGVWTFVVQLGVLMSGMMFANMLRRWIKPLRQSLIPSSVIGGFLILAINTIFKSNGIPIFQTNVLEMLTYHGLGLGFVAMALKTSDRVKSRRAKRDVFDTGVTVVSSYLLQGLAGLLITLGLSYFIGNWGASGLLLPMGFGQGPGQAYNWGNVYELATDYPAFDGGTSFGLTIAAMGFVSASIGGVIYLGIMKAKGRVKSSIVNADEMEDLTAERITAKGEIPLSESLDKLTVQIGLVFLTYIAAYALMHFSSLGLDMLGGFYKGTVKPLIWGFNFLIGTVCAMLLKYFFKVWREKGYMKREYRNNFMLNRIAGFMFDMMVVASIAAINLSAFERRDFWLPLLVISITGAVITYIQISVVSKKIFPDYSDEAFLSLYGMLTGTASTGVILVREIDPLFETPAANNLVYQQLWAIVFGFPMLLLMGIAPQSTQMSWITAAALFVLLVCMTAIQFRRFLFGRRKNRKPKSEKA